MKILANALIAFGALATAPIGPSDTRRPSDGQPVRIQVVEVERKFELDAPRGENGVSVTLRDARVLHTGTGVKLIGLSARMHAKSEDERMQCLLAVGTHVIGSVLYQGSPGPRGEPIPSVNDFELGLATPDMDHWIDLVITSAQDPSQAIAHVEAESGGRRHHLVRIRTSR